MQPIPPLLCRDLQNKPFAAFMTHISDAPHSILLLQTEMHIFEDLVEDAKGKKIQKWIDVPWQSRCSSLLAQSASRSVISRVSGSNFSFKG